MQVYLLNIVLNRDFSRFFKGTSDNQLILLPVRLFPRLFLSRTREYHVISLEALSFDDVDVYNPHNSQASDESCHYDNRDSLWRLQSEMFTA